MRSISFHTAIIQKMQNFEVQIGSDVNIREKPPTKTSTTSPSKAKAESSRRSGEVGQQGVLLRFFTGKTEGKKKPAAKRTSINESDSGGKVVKTNRSQAVRPTSATKRQSTSPDAKAASGMKRLSSGPAKVKSPSKKKQVPVHTSSLDKKIAKPQKPVSPKSSVEVSVSPEKKGKKLVVKSSVPQTGKKVVTKSPSDVVIKKKVKRPVSSSGGAKVKQPIPSKGSKVKQRAPSKGQRKQTPNKQKIPAPKKVSSSSKQEKKSELNKGAEKDEASKGEESSEVVSISQELATEPTTGEDVMKKEGGAMIDSLAYDLVQDTIAEVLEGWLLVIQLNFSIMDKLGLRGVLYVI